MPPRPRHRRLLLGLALALASGALATALVAWACVRYVNTFPQIRVVTDSSSLSGSMTIGSTGGVSMTATGSAVSLSTTYDRATFFAGAPGVLLAATDSRDRASTLYRAESRCHAGWPFLAMQSWSRATSAGPFTFGSAPIPSLAAGIPARGMTTGIPLRYPLLPLFPGFLYDTLLYAALLWLPLATFSHLRARYLRARRGRCPRCHYDLRGLPTPTCPECGAPVPA